MHITESMRFGKHGQALRNVLSVGRKRLVTNNQLTSWGWFVLVQNEDESFSAHWFTTYRDFDCREMTDHYVGAGVDIKANCKPTTPDEFMSDLKSKGYTEVFMAGWPCQVIASELVAEMEES